VATDLDVFQIVYSVADGPQCTKYGQTTAYAYKRLLMTFAFELSLCAVLYFGLSIVERTLALRRAYFQYFCSGHKSGRP
jgi:hypothetical protein